MRIFPQVHKVLSTDVLRPLMQYAYIDKDLYLYATNSIILSKIKLSEFFKESDISNLSGKLLCSNTLKAMSGTNVFRIDFEKDRLIVFNKQNNPVSVWHYAGISNEDESITGYCSVTGSPNKEHWTPLRFNSVIDTSSLFEFGYCRHGVDAKLLMLLAESMSWLSTKMVLHTYHKYKREDLMELKDNAHIIMVKPLQELDYETCGYIMPVRIN